MIVAMGPSPTDFAWEASGGHVKQPRPAGGHFLYIDISTPQPEHAMGFVRRPQRRAASSQQRRSINRQALNAER